MKTENELRKHCEIGILEFDLVVTRRIAEKAVTACPDYFKWMMKSSNLDIGENTNIEDLSAEQMVSLLQMDEQMVDVGEPFVKAALPLMLEKAETSLVGFATYKDYADHIIEYCEENGVWFDFEDANGDVNSGVLNKLMEFVNKAFTLRKHVSKAKITKFAM